MAVIIEPATRLRECAIRRDGRGQPFRDGSTASLSANVTEIGDPLHVLFRRVVLQCRPSQQHGGTNEDSCIGIVRRRSPRHGIHGAGASRDSRHGCTACRHRSRLALRAGLAHQSLGSLRPEPAHLSSLSILGTATFPLASPPSPLAAPSLAASSLPPTPPSSPRISLVIACASPASFIEARVLEESQSGPEAQRHLEHKNSLFRACFRLYRTELAPTC